VTRVLFLLRKKLPTVLGIRHWLIISSSFSLLLLVVRVMTSGRFSYAFLAWNLFLAVIPYALSNWLSRNLNLMKRRVGLFFLVFTWLLFMPNCFYILTDLFHLDNMSNGRPWFDLTLILSFAWNGILFGIVSMRTMEKLLAKAKGKLISAVIICIVMGLNAFGIYLGRFLRFNSWDIIISPLALFDEVTQLVLNPYDFRSVWAMSICFALFMIILYYSSNKLSEPD